MQQLPTRHNTRNVVFSVSNAPGTGLQTLSYKRLTTSWVIAPYFIALFLLALPSLLRLDAVENTGELIAVGLSNQATGPWQSVNLGSLQLPDNHGWLRVVFTLPVANATTDSTPLGLYLSGTFSARVLWNGQEVGQKGVPGISPAEETPGPVDAIIHLPANTLSPGNNVALIELSSHFRQRSLNTILHGSEALPGLRLASYSAETRRPISYYAAPLLTFALLLVAVFAIASTHAYARKLALTLVLSLAVASAAEIFRAFYAYPYSWHMLRLGLLACGLMVFACTLPFYVAKRTDIVFPAIALPITLVTGIAATLLIGPPQDAVHTVLWLTVPISIALTIRSTHHDIKGNGLLLSALAWLMFSLLLNQDLFFDQYLYVAVLPLLAAVCRPRQAEIHEREFRPEAKSDITPAQPERLIVNTAGRNRVLAINDIIAIQGAGNYSEIKLASGESVLDDRPLKQLLTLLPSAFMRAHRSHLVNLNEVRELRSLGGGKYELLLNHDQRCPLSRTHVREIRERLGET